MPLLFPQPYASPMPQIIQQPFDSHVPLPHRLKLQSAHRVSSSPAQILLPFHPNNPLTSSHPDSTQLPVSLRTTQHARLVFHSVSVSGTHLIDAHGCRTARLSAKHKHVYTGVCADRKVCQKLISAHMSQA